MAVIEIEGLRKEFRRLRGGVNVAVSSLDLSVPEGGVFGFLGPNGSGKTTTIRCLLGLVRPTSGRCRILGADAETELPRVIKRIGSIVETPALFATFSGRLNLELLARIDGVGPNAITAMLERVGLAERADDAVKTYSLGMKQRLAVAAALLKDPDLLILDEPANGLDPGGIKEIRDLIRLLASEGRTIFVSSHILSEVQQVCDRVAILTRGRCVASGPVREVLSNGRATGLIVRLEGMDGAVGVLRDAGIPASQDGDALHVDVDPSAAARVTKALADAGLYVTELRADEADLETVFLELTRDAAGEEVPA
jgi:ABC-2 type transport system ATP-binding protein